MFICHSGRGRDSTIDLTISFISAPGTPVISITFHNPCPSFGTSTRYRQEIHVTRSWLIDGANPISEQLEEMNFCVEGRRLPPTKRPLKFNPSPPSSSYDDHCSPRISRFRMTSHESAPLASHRDGIPLKERWSNADSNRVYDAWLIRRWLSARFVLSKLNSAWLLVAHV